MKEKIIIALDVNELSEARKIVDHLPDAVFFKVGLQAYVKFGADIIAYLKEKKKKLFLDLKFKDIPNTVIGAVQSALKYDPAFLTIHASGGPEMIKKAVETAAQEPGLMILGVTVLTSLSNQDLEAIGYNISTEDLVLRLCQLGLDQGLRAFVCSPREIQPIRRRFGKDIILVTPGIRPAGSEKGDQKRVFTPNQAMEAGSDYLVIGRPITHHPDPAKAMGDILEEMIQI